LAAAITISRGAPANVPAGRPERNRIPSKIDEHRKKLLKVNAAPMAVVA
jgi:hypothetical protein